MWLKYVWLQIFYRLHYFSKTNVGLLSDYYDYFIYIMLLYSSFKISILGKKHEVYTHSYLGLGLMAARKAIFTFGQDLQKSANDDVIEVASPCMAVTKPQTWFQCY